MGFCVAVSAMKQCRTDDLILRCCGLLICWAMKIKNKNRTKSKKNCYKVNVEFG